MLAPNVARCSFCGYEDDTKCGPIRLEGAMTMTELRQRLDSLPRDQDIILYCA